MSLDTNAKYHQVPAGDHLESAYPTPSPAYSGPYTKYHQVPGGDQHGIASPASAPAYSGADAKNHQFRAEDHLESASSSSAPADNVADPKYHRVLGGDQLHNTSSAADPAYRGLLAVVLSGLLASCVSVIVKLMTNLHPGQLAVYRFLAISTFSLPVLVRSCQHPLGPRECRILMFLRALCVASNEYLLFIAFRYLPLGEAAIITRSLPVFVTICARIFLKEPCGLFQSLTLLMTMLGVILGSHVRFWITGTAPSYDDDNYVYGLLAAVGALFFGVIRTIALRKMKKVHVAVITFNGAWIAVLECAVLTEIFGDFQHVDCAMHQWWLIIALGVCSYVSQTFMILALQCESAGPVTNMKSVTVLTAAFVWQNCFFHQAPDVVSIAGAVIVVLSGVLVGLRKWAQSGAQVSEIPSATEVVESVRV